MRIAHARREEMAAIDKAHGGAGPILFKSEKWQDEGKS